MDEDTMLEKYSTHMGFSLPSEEASKDIVDHKKLETAFHHAHRIREFEINLYWTRTNYFWGFQVVFFGAFGLLTQALVQIKCDDTEVKIWVTACIFTLCITAVIFCGFWLKMLDGAKFWQDNWERHVDLMEDKITGPLYKTYFSKLDISGAVRPASVTKVNRAIATLIQILWLFISFGTAILFYSTIAPFSIPEAISSLSVCVLFMVVVVAPIVPWLTSFNLRMDVSGAKVIASDTHSHQIQVRPHLSEKKNDY